MTLKQILKHFNIYTLADAAPLLGVKVSTLKYQCQQGDHDAVKIAKTWLIKIK